MAIIRQKNKKTGITYVYESFSYRDKTTKKPKSRRRLIGRVDEGSGLVVPTRRQNRKGTTSSEADGPAGQSPGLDALQEMESLISELRRQNARHRKERSSLADELERLARMLRE